MASKPSDSDSAPLEDVIYLTNPFTTIRPNASITRYLLVMVPGNPGLIEFYRPFLSHLFARLQSQHKDGVTVEVYGLSMAGFAVSPEGRKRQRSWLKPYGLQEQINYMERKVMEVSERMERQGAKPRIVLMGHSVGSYVLLELLRRHRKRLEAGKEEGEGENAGEPDIVGGICLFPTVVNIGLSKKGKGLSKLSKAPILSYILGVMLNLMTYMIPNAMALMLAEKVGKTSKANARIITGWLKSGGLLQAL
jgi:hypothetical protein